MPRHNLFATGSDLKFGKEPRLLYIVNGHDSRFRRAARQLLTARVERQEKGRRFVGERSPERAPGRRLQEPDTTIIPRDREHRSVERKGDSQDRGVPAI